MSVQSISQGTRRLAKGKFIEIKTEEYWDIVNNRTGRIGAYRIITGGNKNGKVSENRNQAREGLSVLCG